MEFRIPGPLEVTDGDQPVQVGGARERALLAILLSHPGEVVSADRLIDELWGIRPARQPRERAPGGGVQGPAGP